MQSVLLVLYLYLVIFCAFIFFTATPLCSKIATLNSNAFFCIIAAIAVCFITCRQRLGSKQPLYKVFS